MENPFFVPKGRQSKAATQEENKPLQSHKESTFPFPSAYLIFLGQWPLGVLCGLNEFGEVGHSLTSFCLFPSLLLLGNGRASTGREKLLSAHLILVVDWNSKHPTFTSSLSGEKRHKKSISTFNGWFLFPIKSNTISLKNSSNASILISTICSRFCTSCIASGWVGCMPTYQCKWKGREAPLLG